MFVPHTKKQQESYERAIDLYYNKGFSANHISKVLNLGSSTIDRWIAIFASENPMVASIMKKRSVKPEPQVEQEPRTDLPEDVKALQAEVLRLKKELKQEKMRADAYDMMIDLAEDAFKIPIRKKSGAEQ